MTQDRTDIMLDILKNIQADLAAVKCEQSLQGVRLLALEKMRIDGIEDRLGLTGTEH